MRQASSHRKQNRDAVHLSNVHMRQLIIALAHEKAKNTHRPPATPPAAKDLHIWLQVGAVLFFTLLFSR